MKRRIVIKKITQWVGICPHCFTPVSNYITHVGYAGTCVPCNKELNANAIISYRRHGEPLLWNSNKFDKRINNTFK